MSSATQQESYFVPLDDGRYLPTAYSGGTWREDELHLAPVAGLIVHALEQWRAEQVKEPLVFSRFSIEVLGQIPREPIEIDVQVVRPGRTIQLVEATAVIAERVILRARAWLLQASDTSAVAGHEFEPLLPPETFHQRSTLHDWPGGFCASVTAVQSDEYRPGRAQTWVTSDIALVAGEPVSALANFCKVLDTANGVAVRRSPREWMFPNVDLVLHFFRQPQGAWAGLDTRVAFGAEGIGVTSTIMHDLDGPVGTIQQALTLREL